MFSFVKGAVPKVQYVSIVFTYNPGAYGLVLTSLLS